MKKNEIIFYSALGAIVAGHAFAGIRVGNLSRNYAGTYKNVVGLEQQYYNTVSQNQADVVVAQPDLPVPVADSELATQARNNDADADINIATLDACAKIYPDGEFVWDRPTLGRNAGGAPTCVSIVEMRAIKPSNTTEYTVVARGKLAAGDIVNCNISDFPTASYLPGIVDVIFPADNAPTRQDVINVLNEEQKNKAGLKIAAATLAAGIAGNMVGKQEIGSDALFGTNSDKLKSTAAGAAIGAALMTASTYSGKVAGDVILHTGVNAAAGGIIGNMMASGDSVLRVEKCRYNGVETTCLWGNIVETKENSADPDTKFYDVNNQRVIVCGELSGGVYTGCKTRYDYQLNFIKGANSAKIYPSDLTSGKSFESLFSGVDEYMIPEGLNDQVKSGVGGLYLAEASQIKKTTPAVIVNFKDSAFGIKYKDWNAWRGQNPAATICLRDSHGDPYDCGGEENKTYDINNFSPISWDASDGGVVDFSNKARLGSTIKGAGIGGALGGFAGYQGAQSDIEERFVQATREYNDSLEKFYCASGRRFISFYNDEVIIPEMKK